MSAAIIPFPEDHRTVPLTSLAAEWRYLTARAAWIKALRSGESPGRCISREEANDWGAATRPTKARARQMQSELAEASNYLIQFRQPLAERIERVNHINELMTVQTRQDLVRAIADRYRGPDPAA